MRCPRLVAVALLGVAALAAPVGAEPETLRPEAERQLVVVAQAEPGPTWDEAVASLKAGTALERSRLSAVLDRLARERHTAWVTAASRIENVASPVGDGRVAAEAVRTWDEARATAKAWIFDEVRFPAPKDPRVTGPKEGYGEAKLRGDAAMRAWNRLEPHVARSLASSSRLEAAKARAWLAARDTARAAFAHVAVHLPDTTRWTLLPPAVDPFADTLVRLRAGEFDGFLAVWQVEPAGWRRLCLFVAWCEALLARNADRPLEMEGDAIRGIEAINGYRRGLGTSPLVHDERLVRAARSHSAEMISLAFFSHRSPTASRATKEMRVALEGYASRVVECITAAGGGTAALEFWKYDGAHHRDLVDPSLVEAGMGTRGPAVYVAGVGGPSSLPIISY